jgi:regulation of enolase protein 1 (concanavalin A-like superfamily)
MEWFNEPPAWKNHGNTIDITTAPKTDFWRKTHYGFIRDNGHFYYRRVSGNFMAELKVSGKYRDLYDQAGLMVRLDELHWMKCGIEFVGGVQQASAVVTRDYSDWSVVPLPQNPPAIWLRVERQGDALEVQYSVDGRSYSLLRLAYLTLEDTLQGGLMCCSPEGNGFDATFEGFKIQTSTNTP